MSFFRRAMMAAAGASAPPSGPSLPLDWSTDLTFARASAATHWDGTTLTRYSSGQARVLGDGYLVVEGARTNRLDQSHVFTVSSNCTVSIDTGTDPAGGSACDQVAITGNGGRAESVGSSTTTADTVSTVFTKTVSGADLWTFVYPVSTGFTAGATWSRVSAFLAGATGTATQRVRVQEAAASNDHVALFFGAQIEWGCEFASSLIEVTGAPATRLADDAAIADASVPAAMRSGSFQVVIRPRRASTQANDTSTGTLFAYGTGTDNRIHIDSSNRIVVRQGGVDVVTTGALTWSADQAITLTFDAAAGSVTVSGATTGNGTTTDTAWTMPSGDVQVGNDAALGTAFFGAISPPVAP